MDSEYDQNDDAIESDQGKKEAENLVKKNQQDLS